jgi:sulfur carrier protein
MEVRVEMIGEGRRTVTVAEPATYADVIRACGHSPQAVTAIVDGHPRPADTPLETDQLRLLRLIKGG